MPERLTPYIVLNGNAREAVDFYANALGAKVQGVMTFGQMPGGAGQLPPGTENRVMHAALQFGESELMLSDTFPGQPFQLGHQVTILIATDSKERTQQFFAALSEGGTVDMPLQETSWSPLYGSLTDKFGVTFQLYTSGQ